MGLHSVDGCVVTEELAWACTGVQVRPRFPFRSRCIPRPPQHVSHTGLFSPTPLPPSLLAHSPPTDGHGGQRSGGNAADPLGERRAEEKVPRPHDGGAARGGACRSSPCSFTARRSFLFSPCPSFPHQDALTPPSSLCPVYGYALVLRCDRAGRWLGRGRRQDHRAQSRQRESALVCACCGPGVVWLPRASSHFCISFVTYLQSYV